jgi:RimJ/RimL family protein N-acetyltransferase
VSAQAELRTERLRGEPLGPEHADELAALLSDPRVARTLSPDGRVPAPGGRRAELAAKAEHWLEHGFGLWLLRDRHTGAMVGRGGLQHTLVDGADEVEVGWAIVAERWGQGLATELAVASIELAFGRLELDDVVSFALPHNAASRRVMEKAGLGFERAIERAGAPHVLYRRHRW